ncbi:MAG: aspartate aminotransferase family protein [Alphaproteobacteria bacterium]|nr:aspartate aminotransferase family protein [Alphaproteobacteria bacterium]
MTRVFNRMTAKLPPIAVRAEGINIWDSTGKQYMDACGGAAVSCLGHAHPRVMEAMDRQVRKLDYVHPGFFSGEPAEHLADLLIEDAPKGLTHAYFVSGGSEAMEAALKMARQYFLEIDQPRRTRFISRRQSYHGNTLGALAVGGNLARREPYAPMLMDVSLIAPCFAYRFKRDDETEEQYGRRVADELEAEILRLGPETVAGFTAETVVGATTGCVPPVKGYFKRIREICDKYGVLLVLDEVMSGMGRTGTLHAIEQEGVAPDLMTIAKGLGGGFQAIGAVLVAGKVHDPITNGTGLFMHGHTYMAHPVACAAGLAVVKTIKEEGLVERVRVQGAKLRRRLEARFGNHPHVGDVRGRGLFQAIEIVEDRSAKEAFDPKLVLHERIKQECMARGLLAYPMPGTIDGKRGNHMILAPPYLVTDGEIDTIVERLGDSVDAALAGIGRS